MEKCLVTSYNDVVDNRNLKKVGEIRIIVHKIDSPSEKTQGFSVLYNKASSLDIIGEGHFTDSSLTKNFGIHMDIPANTKTSFYVSNEDSIISLRDKYSLQSIQAFASTKLDNYEQGKGKTIDFSEFAYCNALTSINVTDTASKGRFSDISNLKSLASLYCINTEISGSLKDLANISTLKTLYIDNVASGSINEVDKLDLSILYIYKQTMVGDIAKLPANLVLFRSSGVFTWTERDITSSIFGIYGSVSVDDVDKVLQGLASCTANESSNKSISLIGTRTSASDAAVATLQSKGYTVSITPA